jgi:hypothetical protein
MNVAAATPVVPAVDSSVVTRSGARGTPWYCRLVALGATFILAGILWDISWHSAIGRDTFWTPAHICIHLGGTLGGLVCGWLILRATYFGTADERNAAMSLWGFRGPLGAWVTVWGALAMLTSAPFDNWWHDAYGLDVKILSPPHSVLAAGMYFHVAGGLLLLLGVQNRSADVERPAGRWLFVLAAGILVCLGAVMMTEESLPNLQHTAKFYAWSSALYPILLIPAARAARVPFPATTIAGIYMLLIGAAVWILPLFAATPMLAPIFNPVKTMVPPAFPLWLIAPAFAIDLLLLAFRRRSGWKADLSFAALAAVAFVGLFTTVQWHFSKFLISPEANNRFFAGSQFFTFADRRGVWTHQFWNTDRDPLTLSSLGWALGLAAVSSFVGTVLGNWMKRVKR